MYCMRADRYAITINFVRGSGTLYGTWGDNELFFLFNHPYQGRKWRKCFAGKKKTGRDCSAGLVLAKNCVIDLA